LSDLYPSTCLTREALQGAETLQPAQLSWSIIHHENVTAHGGYTMWTQFYGSLWVVL